MLFNEFDCRCWRRREKFPAATRYFIGHESTSSSSSQTTYNLQSALGDTAAGATAVNTGAYSTDQIEIQNVDTGLVSEFGSENNALANTAIAGNVNVADNALIAQQTTVGQALGFGAEALSDNQATTAEALGFGAEVSHDALQQVTGVASAAEQSAQNTALSANEQLGSLANDLAAITANAAPQTAAAQNELLSGSGPLPSGGGTTSTNLETYAVIGGFLLAAVAFFRSRATSD
jgi:hypothetical protein